MTSIDQQAAQWLARLRAGHRADQAAFEQWYSADPAHADAYDRVLATWEQARNLAGSDIAAPKSRFGRYHLVGAVAAAAALALVGVGMIHQWRGSDGPVRTALASKAGEIRTIVLADGSRVTLDTASAVRTDFDRDGRHVALLRGRARFEIHPDTRPFEIQAGGGAIIASNGLLDVLFDGRQTSIGLLRGEAELRPGAAGAGPLRLRSGQAINYSVGRMPGPVRRLTIADTRWTSGMLSFENAPLAEVVAAANRYGGPRIILADPSIGALKFTGTFKAVDTAALSQMIAAMFGLTSRTTASGDLVLSRPAGWQSSNGPEKIPG